MGAQPLVKDRKTDYWWVDSRRLVFEEGYNERENFGDIKGLADTIRDGGIRTPLQCYKRGEEYVVRRGHRRTMALRLLEKEMVPIIVPILLVPKGYSPETAVLDLIVENEALPFTPWEQAKVARKLRSFGWSPGQIAEKAGKSKVYIKRLLSLVDAPQKIIDLVREGRVSATLAMDLIAEGKTEELIAKAQSQSVVPAKENTELFPSEPSGKVEKLTKTDVRPNSIKLFKKWSPQIDEKKLPPEKAKFFDFVQRMIQGELTEEDFKKMFK